MAFRFNLLTYLYKKRRFFLRSIVIMAIAVILELTLANRAYYAHFWQGEESADFETVNMSYADGNYTPDPNSNGRPEFIFKNLNRRVNSIYIKPSENWGWDQMEFAVGYADQNRSWTHVAGIFVVRGFTRTNYQEINPYGDVGTLKIMPVHHFMISEVVVNKIIPFEFNVVRVLLVWLIVGGIYFLAKTDIRKTVFDPTSVYQKIIFTGILIGFIVICFAIGSFIGTNDITEPFDRMVDRIKQWEVDLGEEAPRELLEMDRPYDDVAREIARIPLPGLAWDNAYYKGKFYLQHGIAPVIFLYLPYNLITGNYLKNTWAIFVCASLTGLSLALAWRAIVSRCFKQMPFTMYVCTTIAAIFSSFTTVGLYLGRKYTVATSSGLMFVALGFWLLCQASIGKDGKPATQPSYLQIALGCLCMSLAVGCRPTLLGASLIIPVMLWRLMYKPTAARNTIVWKVVLSAGIPYFSVLMLLLWYNYVRFESFFEFGPGVVMGYPNINSLKLVNPMGKLYVAIQGVKNALFAPIHFSSAFPYMLNSGTIGVSPEYPPRGAITYAGLISFPIYYALGFIPVVFRKAVKQARLLVEISCTMLVAGLIIVIGTSVLVGMFVRYQMDYMWLFLFPALAFSYFTWEWYGRSQILAKLICVACIVSAVLGGLTAGDNGAFRLLTLEAFTYIRLLFAPF